MIIYIDIFKEIYFIIECSFLVYCCAHVLVFSVHTLFFSKYIVYWIGLDSDWILELLFYVFDSLRYYYTIYRDLSLHQQRSVLNLNITLCVSLYIMQFGDNPLSNNLISLI
jgi:hypothetical protein